MLKYCLRKWDENKNNLEKQLRRDTTLNSCEYVDLVKLLVTHVLNQGANDDLIWDTENITVVNNGDYQGTQLFLIPLKTYQPTEYEYLLTYVGYGSCPGCDTLQAIQNWDEKLLTEDQVKHFMTLCKDLLTNMIKPYNYGWRFKGDFEQCSLS